MSADLVDVCLSYSKIHNHPIMIIASRNQVDADSGYAFTTRDLVAHINNHDDYRPDLVLLCRDHCGPYFSDLDQGLSLDAAMMRCYNTIKADIESGFDIIHVDVSRVPPDRQEQCSHDLFKYALALDSEIMFEYGTEDNSIENLHSAADAMTHQISIANHYSNNVKFIVSRTGSLVKHKQVGFFDSINNSYMAEAIHNAGYLFKEHNADYLNRSQINLRRDTGIDAVNIAPQLGSIQSEIIYSLARENPMLGKFIDTVIDSGYWRKWCPEDILDTKTRFVSSAHYSFGTQSYENLRQTIDTAVFLAALKKEVHSVLDEYRLGYAVQVQSHK